MDITRDVMAMEQQGRPLKEIRSTIDGKYSRVGPATKTKLP